MKRTAVLFLCLAFFSLACVWTASPMIEYPTIVPSATVEELPMTATIAPQLCATVTAARSLHLRNGPSADDIVLTWLDRGDVVEVISREDSEWWRVEFDGLEGYARSLYLEESECK